MNTTNLENANPVTSAQPEVSIILPSHNEVRLLATTVANIAAGLDQRKLDYEILIVENGSTDGTLRLARLLSIQLDRVRVLTLPTGNYGAALRAGFEAANGHVVVNFDVDYYDLGFLDEALRLIGDSCDLVLASKRAIGSRDQRSLLRRTLTTGFTRTMQLVLELDVTDAHGMKAMIRSSFEPIVEKCTMTGSVFDVELVLRAVREGRIVKEVPVVVVEIRAPRTSLWFRSIETALGLIRLRLSVSGQRHLSRRRGAHRA